VGQVRHQRKRTQADNQHHPLPIPAAARSGCRRGRHARQGGAPFYNRLGSRQCGRKTLVRGLREGTASTHISDWKEFA
jgi:hypothetical protein